MPSPPRCLHLLLLLLLLLLLHLLFCLLASVDPFLRARKLDRSITSTSLSPLSLLNNHIFLSINDRERQRERKVPPKFLGSYSRERKNFPLDEIPFRRNRATSQSITDDSPLSPTIVSSKHARRLQRVPYPFLRAREKAAGMAF